MHSSASLHIRLIAFKLFFASNSYTLRWKAILRKALQDSKHHAIKHSLLDRASSRLVSQFGIPSRKFAQLITKARFNLVGLAAIVQAGEKIDAALAILRFSMRSKRQRKQKDRNSLKRKRTDSVHNEYEDVDPE